MDCGLKLELQQKLIMTPQLRQAIAMLQLPSLELAAVIEQELLENPLLDVAEADNEPLEEQSALDNSTSLYEDWMAYLSAGDGYHVSGTSEQVVFETFATSAITLQDSLELQLDMVSVAADIKAAGRYLIGCIDDNGYLQGTIEEAALAFGVSNSTMEEALAVIQKFDPEGVGARDVRECLILQLNMRGIQNTIVRAIVSDLLEDVGRGALKAIASKLDVSLGVVQHAVDIIRTLNPKPGQAFSNNQPNYILPDVTVERVQGEYSIVVNDQMVPRLIIHPEYRRLVRDDDSEARKFVEGRLQAAIWVVKSIEQRRNTLYNVMKAIVDLQRDFFDYGPQCLRPLIMKTVADHVGIHESTVSRATANKYAATPHGLFSLRSFFSGGVAGADGDDVSANTVKREIRQAIANENSAAPHSDQALCEILRERGRIISRRTVAKYREEMKIASSSKRKRY